MLIEEGNMEVAFASQDILQEVFDIVGGMKKLKSICKKTKE